VAGVVRGAVNRAARGATAGAVLELYLLEVPYLELIELVNPSC
jgi:hypothetical protein